MEYSVGKKVIGTVYNVKDNGVLVTFGHGQFGFCPKRLMPSYLDDNGDFNKKKGDKIQIVIYKIEDDHILLSDAKSYQKEVDKQHKIAEFASEYERGQIFEAEVVEVKTHEAHIRIGDVEGIIAKEEIDWNEINQLTDLLYKGEYIKAVYLGVANNKLCFGLKYLNTKPYADNLYDLNLNQLLKFIGHTQRTFIGQAKQYGKYTFFENLRSEDGTLLIDPIYGYNLRALFVGSSIILKGLFYKVKIQLLPKYKRIERNQLFQFTTNEVEEVPNPYKGDVELTFEKNTSPATNVTVAHLLAEVGKNMYSSKDRMLFELVQNADDAAARDGVSINISSAGDYLLVCHNGYSFNKEDFEAITSAANGTKKANENKTGYKGIGFKSVFTDSEVVYIKTGGYSFKFDKQDERFANFNTFYFMVNNLLTEEDKKKFLQKYSSEKSKFTGVSDIPWQLEPIWVDSFPNIIGEAFTKFNVSIALKLGENKLIGANGYLEAIDGIITAPKFMLFLRNTKRIVFNGKTVSKELEGNMITLKNSFSTDRVERFIRKDFDIPISNDIFERRHVDIRIKVEDKDEQTDKIIEAKFVDLHNQEIESIPKKIAISNSTSISFAIPVADEHIHPMKKRTDISLFAFLPTLVKDFKFPFYINANFILDPPRQRILGDNPWNFYLMQEIAIHLVQWCASLCSAGEKYALYVLLPEYFDDTISDTKYLAQSFNEAYRSALRSEAFILSYTDTLCKQEEIIIDNTGLSKILGVELFLQIISTSKQLPSANIDSSILLKDIFEYKETVNLKNIKNILNDNNAFKLWYIDASIDKKEMLNDWLIYNKFENVIDSLPLFKLGTEWKAWKEINGDNIVTTEHILPIKTILTKLGFVCSDEVLEQHSMQKYIVPRSEKELFNAIVTRLRDSILTSDEKLLLIKAFANFRDVGDTEISNIQLFNNLNGIPTLLSKMRSYRESAESWLAPYVLCKEENFEELQGYLIKDENEFLGIVRVNYEALFKNNSIRVFYDKYRDQWTNQFTRELIDKYGVGNVDIVSIVEEADKKTKEYYLGKIGKVSLEDGNMYGKDSLQYRYLLLALDVYGDEVSSKFSQKIYFMNVCITQFSVDDDVVCQFSENNKMRTIKMSLLKLLPHYQNISGVTNRIKALFVGFNRKDLDMFFVARPKQPTEVFDELNKVLQIYNNQWIPSIGNAMQYLFSVYYRREKRGWYNGWIPRVDLSQESNDFVNELMNFLFDNHIDISSTSSFTYHIIEYFRNKYFNNDYVFENECLLSIIEKWADEGTKKKEYLQINGIRGIEDKSIAFRKLFSEDKSIDYIDDISDIDAFAGLKYFACAVGLAKPFVGTNQIEVLDNIRRRKNSGITESINLVKLSKDSQEWDSPDYNKWIEEHTLHIFIYSDEMPQNVLYKDVLLYEYKQGDFYYDAQNRILYVNGEDKTRIQNILNGIAQDKNIPFNNDDWLFLFLEGKTTISTEELSKKDEAIDRLEIENGELKKILNKHGIPYKKWFCEADNALIGGLAPNHVQPLQPNVISRPELSQNEQIAAHKEAEQIVKKKLEEDGYDCSDWGIDVSLEIDGNSWRSVNQVEKLIKNPAGELINLVVKSAKGGYIYLSATDFEFLTSDSSNVLMVWDGNKVHSVTGEQVFNKDSNVNLIFDTEYTPKHYYAALSKVFQYVKRTTFAVKNPVYSAYDKVQSFGMDSKIEGIQELFDDNDI
jgi:predicted RNA-binding protein with RPS1 domain